MSTEPIITTQRLIFRRLNTGDGAFLLKLMNEPSYHQNIGDRGVRTLQQAVDYLEQKLLPPYEQHGFGMWHVSLSASGEAIGVCGLIKRPTLEHVDVGFALFPTFWGKGYAFEAAQAACQYGIQILNLPKIVGIVSEHNKASIRILEKLGMKFQRKTEVIPGDVVLLYE